MSTSLIEDQRGMMRAFGNVLDAYDYSQASLYQDLVDEEYEELDEAMSALHVEQKTYGAPTIETVAKVVDGAVDLVVTALGLLESLGVPAQKCWDEVLRSNMAKVAEDGMVKRNIVGKIMKPAGWAPPNLVGVLAPYVAMPEIRAD